MGFSEFDKKFIENLKDIIENGTEYESRAVWEDGTHAKCIKKFGVVNRYNSDYSNKPPVGTLRKLAIKSCVDELLWIWKKKSNDIYDLKSHVWDQWADNNGSIGAAYGFQVASKLRKVMHESIKEDEGKIVNFMQPMYLDQTDYVLHELTFNPFSRRIITDLYSVGDTALMGLDPCCYSCTWNVTEKDDKRYLNLLLNQRSQDMIVANNWNVFQYWVLQNLFALDASLEVGELVHVIADCHIYDRHISIAKHLIELYENKDNEKLVHCPEIKFNWCTSFYEIDPEDVIVENYKYLENITKIPVAI